MDIYRQLALLTDSQSERCLQGMIKAKTVVDPAFRKLASSQEEMQNALRQADANAPVTEMAEPQDPEKQAEAVRLALVTAADDPQLRQAIEDYLESQRDVLFEPVTTALVLAGIVFVLQTKFSVHFEDVDGKKQVKVDVGKDPTSDSLLGRFFDIFKPGVPTTKT